VKHRLPDPFRRGAFDGPEERKSFCVGLFGKWRFKIGNVNTALADCAWARAPLEGVP
jgi:hypothetical protein